MEYVEPPPSWEVGRQGILNSRDARVPEHTFKAPVPVVVRIMCERDGEEHIETEALGWSNGDAYVRLAPGVVESRPGPACQLLVPRSS